MKTFFFLAMAIFSVTQGQAYDPWAKNVSWTSHDGKRLWSGVLDKHHPNCISEKDGSGLPVMTSANTVKCKTNVNGHYLNSEKGGQDVFVETTTIQKSDATEACRKLGGRLPTIDDFQELRIDPDFYSFPDKEHYFISSSLRTRNNYRLSLGLNGQSGNLFVYSVERLDSTKVIRCLKDLR